MRTMRIGEITCCKNLVWFYFLQKIDRYLNIFFTHRFFLNGPCFIKRKVEKMNIFFLDAHITTSRFCFASPDQSFYRSYLVRIFLVGFFLGKVLSVQDVPVSPHLVFLLASQ